MAADYGVRGAEAGADAAALDGLRISVEAPSALPPLPAAVEVAAYRIAQEALANVVRHAHARTCVVRLALAGHDTLCVEVVDDGVGPASAGSQGRAGVGLIAMRERAAELGGTCVVEPPPAGGTCVLARLPLAPAHPPASGGA